MNTTEKYLNNIVASLGGDTNKVELPATPTSKVSTYLDTIVDLIENNSSGSSGNYGLPFTQSDKDKLDGLNNYDDTEIKEDIYKTTQYMVGDMTTIGYRRKNLFRKYTSTRTRNNVTAIVNNDGSITFTGINSGGPVEMYANMLDPNLNNGWITNYLPNGTYVISGFNSSAYVRFGVTTQYGSPMGVVDVLDEPIKFTVTSADKFIRCQLIIPAGVNFIENPITIYPMIRVAEIEDSTYEPFVPSLYERLSYVEERLGISWE